MNETYLNEYFRYIKVVFLREYSKYLSEEKINKIKNMDNIFKVDDVSKYKIFITDKINVCTNIVDFIKENNLNNDSDLRDISIDGRIYVKYLLDNKNTPIKFILDTILETIIKYFIGNCDNVIKIGMVDMIADSLAKKYNLKNIRPYKSKEMKVSFEIKKIVTDDIFYKSLLNNTNEIVDKYNEYVNFELCNLDYESLIRELNKEFFDGYYKKIGKVYFSDTLYDYENINYNKILNELNKINEYHNKDINIKINRILSAKKGTEELKQHLIIFDTNEQFLINNALIEIDNILNKINESNIDIIYSKFEKIENQLFSLTQKLWKKEINNPLYYTEENNFKFLIGDYPNKDLTETRLVSNYQLDKIPCKIKEYGFIYGVNDNIIYSSTKNFLYSTHNDELEIDDKSDSILITPNIIISSNLKNSNLTGKILLKNAIPSGIYVISNIESKYYERALELADKYELPLVKINCILPQIKSEDIPIQIEKKVEKQPKISLKDKIKNFSHKMIYDEEIEDLKKII